MDTIASLLRERVTLQVNSVDRIFFAGYIPKLRASRFGVVMIGVAQERCPVWRGYRSGGPDWHPHFSYRRMSACPNHYYF